MSGVELATAWVRLVPSVEGIQGAIAKEMGSAGVEAEGEKVGGRFTSGFRSKMSGVGQALLGAFAVSAVIGGVKSAVDAASDLAEAGTAVGEIFGDSYAGIETWSKTAAGTLGQSQLQALNAAKTFGIYGQSAGLAGEANVEFSTGMAELATDLASFHNASPEETVEALGAALRGENEPMRRFGVLLDDATLRQEALALGLISTTKDALTPQQKVLAAQSAIMKQTAVAQGDFERTSGGLANQQRILAATMTDLSAAAGQALLPVMQSVASALVPVLGYIAENQWVLGVAATVIGVALVAAFIAWTSSIWAANVALLANPVTWIVIGILALIAAVVALVMNWDAVVAWVTEIWGGFISWITEVINGFVGWWDGMWGAVGAWFEQLWAGIVFAVRLYILMVQTIIRTIVTAIAAVWNGIWSGISSFFMGIWNGIVSAVQNFGSFFRSIFDGIAGFVRSAFNGVLGAVRGPINAIISLVNSAISGLNQLRVTIPDWVPGVGGQTFGLNLPKIPMLADGGTVLRSGAVIVGERGPEMLRLPAGAVVDPDISNAGATSNEVKVIAAPDFDYVRLAREVVREIRWASA